jgi:membrane-associated protease RseP (regulator of RpoE activity)
MTMPRLFLACLLAGSPLALAQADDTAPQPVQKWTAPFEILPTKHMAIKITVNGKGPFRVIFDTGAPISLISNKLAQEAELVKGKPRGGMLMGMGGQVTIKEFGLGDLKADKVQVIIMDHPAITAISKALGRVDGIIGFPFFARYKVTLDYEKQTLTFEPSDYNPGDVMAGLMKMMMSTRAKPVPITLGSQAVWGFSVGKAEQDEEEGIEVTHVFNASAAAAAGLKAGDRLLVLDGTWTDSVNDCYRAVGKVKAGKSVQAKIRREGKEMEITITPRPGL